MAENLTASAMKPLDSTPLGTVSGALQGGVNNLINSGSNILDRFFPPERREDLKARMTKFANEKPKIASFLLSQIALSGVPVALFIVMTLGIIIFALVGGLIVGLIGALLFIVFCVGVALLVLLPTLFVTTFAATFIWLWGLGAYYIIKWFNNKDVPGIHTDLQDGVKDQMGLGGIQDGVTNALNGGGDQKLPPSHEQDPSARPGHGDTKGDGGNEVNGEHEEKPQSKPRPLPEKKDGANATSKQRGE